MTTLTKATTVANIVRPIVLLMAIAAFSLPVLHYEPWTKADSFIAKMLGTSPAQPTP